ncbi:MAG: MarC family protein [Planctomycetes bacterium]|nr:MarC family protein [Planctomycetota bacterium]
MGEDLQSFLKGFAVQAFLSLYIVVNPTTVSSVFLGVTKQASAAERRKIAFLSSLTGGIVLAAFALAGTFLFQVFKITGAALEIAGGIIVFNLAYALVRGREHEFFGNVGEEAGGAGAMKSVAYTPLAVPLIAGPASITVVMTLSAKATGPLTDVTDFSRFKVIQLWILLGVIGLVALRCFFSMLKVLRLEDRFGPGFSLILPRIMGLVLAVIAIQFVVHGMTAILPELGAAWRSSAPAAPP